MDHMRLYATRRKPASQREAVAAGFEGQRNARDSDDDGTFGSVDSLRNQHLGSQGIN
jgi:hypothetical protein